MHGDVDNLSFTTYNTLSAGEYAKVVRQALRHVPLVHFVHHRVLYQILLVAALTS